MPPLEQIKSQIEQAVPGARVEIVPNPSVPAQSSLLLDAEHGSAVASHLRTAAGLRFNYASNVTGVDWPDRVEKILHIYGFFSRFIVFCSRGLDGQADPDPPSFAVAWPFGEPAGDWGWRSPR